MELTLMASAIEVATVTDVVTLADINDTLGNIGFILSLGLGCIVGCLFIKN